ncbi:hypothetical protein EU527_01750 [Candidatus Thorarchaeota archaeon]|nr:MAG: hypothetical protein EU527_01750 [Candidatus Thorarchaeota archaeon]
MSLVVVAIAFFMMLEIGNIFILYFKKDSTRANGIGTFRAWEKSKAHPEIHDFVRYLINWIAGTKIFFLSLLTVIVIFGTPDLHPWVLLAMIFSIASFYVGLFPLARKIDSEDMLIPKGYSKTLVGMITVFIIVFLILYLWPYIIPIPMPSFW